MHTVKRVCTLVLTGLLALPMAAPAGAAAASFSDLPSSHWAYIAMTEAAGYGILQGTGANTMSPSAPLTWPQFLAMAARAFAPEEYARSAASGAAWDQAGLDAARSAGLLEGLDEAALTGAVRCWPAAAGSREPIPAPSPPTPPWCASLPSTAGAGAVTPGPTAATIPRATTTICTSPTWESDQATHPGPRLRGGFPLSPS